MEVFHWVAEHGFDLVGVLGIIASLLFTAFSFRKDDHSRRISNLIAIKQQHREIWREMFEQPALARVLKNNVDLRSMPVTDEESLFVKLLILHLDTAYRAMKAGIFVKLEGLQEDVAEFFSSPIPKAVWEKMKVFQNEDFVAFVEKCRRREHSPE